MMGALYKGYAGPRIPWSQRFMFLLGIIAHWNEDRESAPLSKVCATFAVREVGKLLL